MTADKQSLAATAFPGVDSRQGRLQTGGRGWRVALGLFVVVSSCALPRDGAAEDAKAKPTRAAKKVRRVAPKAVEAPPEIPPLTSEALLRSARSLFDAIVEGKPALADPFFFPREPFLPLKDVDDPGRYHDELVRTYHRDIERLHARRRSWEGARFVGFRLGSPPRWIEPGREWNKIGYYRTFDARLDYEVAGKARQLTVRTIISWDGQWYVTHLAPTKH